MDRELGLHWVPDLAHSAPIRMDGDADGAGRPAALSSRPETLACRHQVEDGPASNMPRLDSDTPCTRHPAPAVTVGDEVQLLGASGTELLQSFLPILRRRAEKEPGLEEGRDG